MEGPFLWLGERKLVVKAVTYGTFSPDRNGDGYPPREVVRRDLRAMRRAHIETFRVYTPPPLWLLDDARAAGLRILAGIPWEGRECRYDEPVYFRDAAEAVSRVVERCRDYPDVVLAYVLGNEIPPLVVRFHGRKVIAGFLRRLYAIAKRLDPEALVTYANYPSTEFLELDFVDFHMMNLYLLEPRALSGYLDRMFLLAKGKPVVLGEVGEDSLRGGEEHQAALLDWTLPLALDKGLAGTCVFAWTDEWVVDRTPIVDWSFGLVDRERRPKRALEVVSRRYAQSPLARRVAPWPRVSVVVCNYNGGETLAETLDSLLALDYSDYEVIYVDDGSTDESLAIARRYEPRIRILAQENRGLGTARNVGAEAATGATGAIVAYIDSDAYADPEWLRYLVIALDTTGSAAAGGPNLTPPSDGTMAQLIAACPGNPTYVLKDDVQADHVAGVNMAIRRDVLLGIGGFDSVHRKAGDDVDICWRILDAEQRIAFAPAAIVWHHRRPSIARYLKQQYGYGEAENQLERKHPERFNLGGYIRWGGRVYLAPRRVSALLRPFIYHGTFGQAMFQTLYQKEPSFLMFGPTMIHWYLVAVCALLLSPLLPWALPLGLGMLLLSLWVALVQGLTTMVAVPLTRTQRLQKVGVVALLHFLHPLVRFAGRLRHRLAHAETGERHELAISLRERLVEIRHGARRRKELRRYAVAAGRDEILRALQRELKVRLVAVAPSNEWSNCDLRVNGTLGAEGCVFSAPDPYGTLWIGFKTYTPEPARIGILLSACAACAAITATTLGALLFVLPGLIAWRSLGQRARLRRETWLAVDDVMARAGAQRKGEERSR
ncbi:MAG: glycosyltransferase [Planctomycetes bacterium]|nr:glycosyltransferase [Planctomycetota bacterium]